MKGDPIAGYELLVDHLVYHDAPYEGLLRRRVDEQLFAFRVRPIIDGLLWHWVLLPTSSIETPIEAVFAAARTAPPDAWVSVVEDLREPLSREFVVTLAASDYKVCW